LQEKLYRFNSQKKKDFYFFHHIYTMYPRASQKQNIDSEEKNIKRRGKDRRRKKKGKPKQKGKG